MHIERTDLSKTELTLNISATKAELSPIKQEVVTRLAKDVKVQGFRKGTAPASLIEKQIDPNLLQSDFLDEAMTQLYAQAALQEQIRPVTRPEVTVKKFVPFTELEFSVTTSVIGDIKIPDYAKLAAPLELEKVAKRDIDQVLSSIQARLAEKKAVKRAAKTGDEVVIDFVGKDKKGVAIDNADGKDYPLLLGSNSFIPGFEDSVVGMKPGEEKTFELTFPKDYGSKDLAGKKVDFTVTAKDVKELESAKLDDELAQKVGPFKTLQELTDDIKKQLEHDRANQARTKQQNAMLEKLNTLTKIDIPQALIDQQIVYNIDETRRELMYKGQTFEEFLKQQNKTEEAYKKELEAPAKEQLTVSLALTEIAERENIEISPEELAVRVQLLKGQYKDEAMHAELDKPENQRDIRSRMRTEKVLAFLTEKTA